MKVSTPTQRFSPSNLVTKTLFFAFFILGSHSSALFAGIYVDIPNMKGDAVLEGFEDRIVAESFGFGLDRSLPEEGGKGGTEDINLGIGEFQTVTLVKVLDRASTKLAQHAVNGNTLGTVVISFVQINGGGKKPEVFLIIKLDRAFVKSWSTSGDREELPREEMELYFSKIAVGHRSLSGDGSKSEISFMTWDRIRNRPWDDHGIQFPSAD